MRPTLTCPECGHRNVVELGMAAKDGTRLTLMSCTRCETRTWAADGEPVTREEMLRITAGDPDFVVTPSPARTRRKAPAKR